MQIIKITPKCFKIILSKEDLKVFGDDDIFDSPDATGTFFSEIIEKTNSLYDAPFKSGAIDAEFFSSKDGGGELFISRKTIDESKPFTYLFEASQIDILINLCKRISTTALPSESSLFWNESQYKLVLFYHGISPLTLSIIKEYGTLLPINKFQLWEIEEHSKVICKDKAIDTLIKQF